MTTISAGTCGRAARVNVNCFEITNLPTCKFHQYHFEIIPDAFERVERRLEIFLALQEQNPSKFRPRAVFDGKHNVYSSLSNLDGQYEVRMGYAQPQNPNARPPKVYIVSIQSTKTIDPLRTNELFAGRQNQISDILAMLQIFVRQAVATRFVYPPTSKTVYTPNGHKPLGFGLEMWRGVFQSVRPGMDRLLINVDASFGIMYARGRLEDVVMEMLGIKNSRGLSELDIGHPKWTQLKTFLKGVKVAVSTSPNRRPRPILDIVPRAGLYTFPWKDEETTVQEYFYRAHRVEIRDPKLFGVVLSKTRKDVVPAQVCTIVEGQVYKKRVPPNVTASMVLSSETKPGDRLNIIKGAVSSQNTILDYANSDFMRDAGLKVATNPMSIEGRYIDAPTIRFGDGPVFAKNGAWNVVNHRLHKPGSIMCWSVVNFVKHLREDVLRRFLDPLVRCLTKLGIQQFDGTGLSSPGMPEIYPGLGQNPIGSLNTALASMQVGETWARCQRAGGECLGASPLMIIILPTSAADIRKSVKHWSDVVTGVPTQCVRENKMSTANDQYCNNLILKINVRIGGVNSAAKDKWMEMLARKPTMIVAADVSHPGPGIMHRPSMAGLVASTDTAFSRYSAFSELQESRKEIIEKLEEMFKNALRRFRDVNNKTPPQRIIFYRDGVSEGEYQKVVKEEVGIMLDVIKELWGQVNRPTLTVIVVGKRHHVRFFPNPRGPDSDRNGNCLGGFVVDKQINNAHGEFFDFYLQSHGGLKGTSKPSHYIVIHNDDPEMSADYLQGISYGLCHVHARATRSVGIPAPVYYADLVCSRVDFHLQGMNYDNESLHSEGTEFSLSTWQNNFKKPKYMDKMYFI